jgi:hypothetical protein
MLSPVLNSILARKPSGVCSSLIKRSFVPNTITMRGASLMYGPS